MKNNPRPGMKKTVSFPENLEVVHTITADGDIHDESGTRRNRRPSHPSVTPPKSILKRSAPPPEAELVRAAKALKQSFSKVFRGHSFRRASTVGSKALPSPPIPASKTAETARLRMSLFVPRTVSFAAETTRALDEAAAGVNRDGFEMEESDK